MNFTAKTMTLLAGCALASTCVGLAPAQAGEMYGDWNYTIDSFDDGSDAGVRGEASAYEFYGMALKETADKVYIAINSNLNLGGEFADSAKDNYIHYGDLLLNFSGSNLGNSQGNLFGIKFDAGNDSGVSGVGLYGNVVGQNVAKDNSGFKTMKEHRDWANGTYKVDGKKVKGTASMGDLSHDEYFQQGKYATTNSIKSGDFLGNISFLSAAELFDAGLNFGAVDAGVVGRHTIGFSFDRNLLPDGDYIAHVFAECLNDGLALTGSLPTVRIPDGGDEADVPEPGLLAGVLLIGGLGFMKRRAIAA